MRKNNWTMIAVAALILALLYYFMQESKCMKCDKKSKSDVSTSLDVESNGALEASQTDGGESNRGWVQEDENLETALQETVVE